MKLNLIKVLLLILLGCFMGRYTTPSVLSIDSNTQVTIDNLSYQLDQCKTLLRN